MPLRWMRSDEFGILTVVGQGNINRHDIEGYLGATVREGTKTHAKLVDLTVGNLTLDRDDLQSPSKYSTISGQSRRLANVTVFPVPVAA